MLAESGGNPDAESRTDDQGLFQIHDGYSTYGDRVFDPSFNIQVAYGYYSRRGWEPWSTFKSGRYRLYL